MEAPRPWYFKDGTPINAEQIRKVVYRARVVLGQVKARQDVNGHEYVPRELRKVDRISRKVIMAAARYFAKRIERQLIQMLFTEFSTLSARRIISSGDEKLDAQRLWRRSYQRAYRRRVKEYEERRK